ncbi:MAG: intradiol ring-cleavage dioxygenase [Blastocatellia bacterium]
MSREAPRNLISRRETLRLIGAAGATALVGWRAGRGMAPARRLASVVEASQLSCVVRPQLTEGPYFVDERLNRSDIRTDPATGAVSAGVPLVLNFNVRRVSGNFCTPLAGAYVDVWHCDAAGSYSDVRDAGFDTRGRKYLRGYQVTDGGGSVQFQTIYPGWYSGRTVHIHFKVRLFTGSEESYEFTSQLFFDDSLSDQVYAQSPYNARGIRNTRNGQDGIYNGGGSQLLLNVARSGQVYAATFDIGLEGITQTGPPSDPPVISGAAVSGKQLIVTGQNFDAGAKVFLNGDKQKTSNDDSSPTTMLIAKKAGKKINAGDSVTLQVRNSDDSLSAEFPFTRPAE